MTQAAFYQDPVLCGKLLEKLRISLLDLGKSIRFMEVCGTHTVSIFQSGLRSLLPAQMIHLSGPGCPVCVTHDSEVNAFLEASQQPGVIIATFGDLLRVPGPDRRSLKTAQADGASVKIVYSPLDALELARAYPDKIVVFLSVGFETTAPVIAGVVKSAKQAGLDNFCIMPCNKLIPPALRLLLDNDDNFSSNIDAFILPGHVSVILGTKPFMFIPEQYHCPAIITGFEPADILLALCLIVDQLKSDRPALVNAYPRVVSNHGSSKALDFMHKVFQVADSRWRGFGIIPNSGLRLRPEYSEFDAFERLGIELREIEAIPGCECGDILSGRKRPPECPLFGRICTPENPVGPCMVSTEGSCAAWKSYQE